MPKLLNSPPRYRLHKASGQAVVTIEGQDFYLGPWKSRASRNAYDRLISEYLVGGRRLHPKQTPDDITVGEVIERFWDHALEYYRRTDGTPTSEVCLFKSALDPLNRLYGQTPARDFGPLSLETVRNAMIEKDWCRRTVNKAAAVCARRFDGRLPMS